MVRSAIGWICWAVQPVCWDQDSSSITLPVQCLAVFNCQAASMDRKVPRLHKMVALLSRTKGKFSWLFGSSGILIVVLVAIFPRHCQSE